MAKTQDPLTAMQARLQDVGMEMAAIGPTANMRFLLDFVPHADERLCLLLIARQVVRMVAPAVNLEAIAAHIDVELFPWADADGPQEALHKACSGLATRSIGVDGAMRADFLVRLQTASNPERIESVDNVLVPLRLRKSADEIDSLARAASQADRAMKAGMEACRVGAAEADVAWAVEAAFRQDRAETVDFTLIASGPNGAYPHHHSGERRLQKGDAIILDIGATLDGYKSDITRMVHLGEPSPEFRNVYAAVLDANQRAMAAVRPGVKSSEIDHAARSTLESAGYGKHFVHRTGHGIGLEGHEPPWIMEGEKNNTARGNDLQYRAGSLPCRSVRRKDRGYCCCDGIGSAQLTGFDHSLVVKD